ncbi:hypothetical protein KSP39_PZI012064 [Platanthera zijinensis]|uniref:GYF domain-containing protein n=1 Tax=Platanthera zijinensis TaxID=2320716 RepID=A0AAP0BG35_9ASPA
MSGLTNADPFHPLTVDPSPPPIPKVLVRIRVVLIPIQPSAFDQLFKKHAFDITGCDEAWFTIWFCIIGVPLCLKKFRVIRNGLLNGGNALVTQKLLLQENNTDPLKSLGNVEDHNVVEKRKDVFRPSFHDTEKVRHDSWADEERDANSAIRRDLQKEGEEFVDSRKLERWSNNSSRYPNESRHFQSERWSGSGSRESAYEPRRESKWNTRWGPDDKVSENWREKCPGKDGDSSFNKGAQHQTVHAKDIKSQGKDTDKEGEHSSRSWRSSMAVNRGRGEAGTYLPSITNKPASMFGYGRGKGDTGAFAFSADRSRVGSSTNNTSGGPTRQFPVGTTADRLNGSHRDPPGLRYNRIKLFDIFRMTDLKGYGKTFEFHEFPSLIQADHLVPLALTAPIAEELVILEAIEKGEILSSGIPQALKDGSIGKNSVDSGLLPLTTSGIGEDVAPVVSGYRDEKTNHGKKGCAPYADSAVFAKSSRLFDLKVPESLGQFQEAKLRAEAIKFEDTPNSTHDSNNRVIKLENTLPWRSQSVGGRSLSSSNDLRDLADDGSRSSDIGWLNTREEMGIELRSRGADSSSYIGGDAQHQDPDNLRPGMRIDSLIRKQPSSSIDHGFADPSILREKLTDRKPQQYPSPEHLSLFYKDPHGQVQGPFSGSNLIEWFDAGYFGIDLLVRFASAPANTPFLMLGDVIPQLRTRVRPPPGFGSSRPNDIVEVSNRGKIVGADGVHVGLSDVVLKKNDQVLGNESKVEAENKFLESLMAGRISSALSESFLLSEGMQGYTGLAGRPSLELDNLSDMKYILQKMSLEQQNFSTPFRPGSDPLSIKADSFREVPIPPKCLPQIGEIPHQQHLDLLSILQSATNKTTPPPINSAWPNFSEIQDASNSHGSINIMKDALGLHPNQQIPQTRFGAPPNMLQTQFQHSLPNQTPFFGLPSGVIPLEKSVSPEYGQDVHMANLLQQQYMLTQNIHSQVPNPTQLNQMELLLLLQRQKLEQQQQQLQQQQYQQQQHQLLSHAFSGRHLHNNYDDKSFGPLKTEVDNANAAVKSPILQMHEVARSNNPVNVFDSNNSHVLGLSDLHLHGAQDTRIADGTEHSSLSLPDQVIDLAIRSNEKGFPPLLDVEPIQMSIPKQMVSISDDSAVSQGLPQTNENVTVTSNAVKDTFSLEKDKIGHYLDPTGSEMIERVKVSFPPTSKQACGETPGAKVVDDAELCEVKKSSEKKSRKHKNFQLLKLAPGLKSKPTLETGVEKHITMEAAEPLQRTELKPLMESLDSHGTHLSSEVALDKETKVDEAKVKEVESVPSSSNNPAWKPAPGQKVKSLLEIQVEEQNKAQKQLFAVGMMHNNILPNVYTPSEQKLAVDTVQYDNFPQSVSENPWGSRSQLHDVLAEEVLPKVSEGNSEEKGTYLSPIPDQNEVAVDHDFIEAKDTRKARKKATKSKVIAIKSSSPGNAAALSISANIVEQTKATLQPQQDKELLPSPPSAPSLGDFVFWKGEEASTVPPPVWSTDSVKIQRPALLKDIFREQDKTTKSVRLQIPSQSLTKVQPSKGNGGGSSLVQVSGSPPSKGQLASPLKTSFLSSGQQKPGAEDDLFWGPINQTKQSSRSYQLVHMPPFSVSEGLSIMSQFLKDHDPSIASPCFGDRRILSSRI